MADDKEDDELPLTEYDDVTHWVGKMEKDNEQKTGTSGQTHSEPTKGKGRPRMGG